MLVEFFLNNKLFKTLNTEMVPANDDRVIFTEPGKGITRYTKEWKVLSTRLHYQLLSDYPNVIEKVRVDLA